MFGLDRDLAMVIVPLAVAQLALMAVGYWDLARREQVRWGRKWLWALVMLINFVGPLLYFTLGREE